MNMPENTIVAAVAGGAQKAKHHTIKIALR